MANKTIYKTKFKMNKAKDILEGNKLIAEFMGDITDNGKEWAATETPLKTKNKNHV